MIYSINLMFILLLTLSTVITISSPSWFCMWIGIEMNTMAFIPILYQVNNKLPTESSLKYFLTQTFASMIMLMAIISMIDNGFYLMMMSSNLMALSMGIKMGSAPFHMWYPSVIEGLSWIKNLMLMTWQKIAPITILSMIQSSNLMMILIFSSLTIGPIMAFNQTSLRKIMAYSSITHMSWMIVSIHNKTLSWINYMVLYFLTTIIVIVMMWNFNIYYTTQIPLMNTNYTFMMLINLFSMGGFPPMLGFIAKWIILNDLINLNMIFTSMMLVLSSCVNLYIYSRIIHSPLHLASSSPKTYIYTNINFSITALLTSISLSASILIMMM